MGKSAFDRIAEKNKAKAGEKKIDTGSSLGRPITTVETAKSELYRSADYVDPIPYIHTAIKDGRTFYGMLHGGKEEGKPFTLPDTSTTMEIYVGSTGTGKGVFLGNKAIEAIKKRTGLIIIDPKKDAFLPQICKEELERQGRTDDLQIAVWPENFGYMGINDTDTYKDTANKIIDAIDLTPSENPGVDYYRKNGRVLLTKILKLFYDGTLGKTVKRDFADILFHMVMLKEDMEKQTLLEREIGKMKPNNNLIEKYKERYYKISDIEKVYWDTTTVETLDSLVKSISEIAEGANIFKKYTLDGALYHGKVLYLRVDMLDVASLKMVKMMIADAIQQARAKMADTIIIADELSFYANQTIAGALATTRSMGLKFLLALQDLAQMKDENIRNAILSNCNVKLFYKISDRETLEYVEKIGGKEAVTAYATNHEGEYRITQQTEEIMNATRIRALPRQGVGIIIAEEMNAPVIIRTNFVQVSQQFDWEPHEKNSNIEKPETNPRSPKNKISVKEETIEGIEDMEGISYTDEDV